MAAIFMWRVFHLHLVFWLTIPFVYWANAPMIESIHIDDEQQQQKNPHRFRRLAITWRQKWWGKTSHHFVTKYFTNEFSRFMLWMYKHYYWMKKLNRINYPLLLLTVFHDPFGFQRIHAADGLICLRATRKSHFGRARLFFLWPLFAIACNFFALILSIRMSAGRFLAQPKATNIRRITLFIFELSKWIYFRIRWKCHEITRRTAPFFFFWLVSRSV